MWSHRSDRIKNQPISFAAPLDHRRKKLMGHGSTHVDPWPMWPISFWRPIWPMTHDSLTHCLLWHSMGVFNHWRVFVVCRDNYLESMHMSAAFLFWRFQSVSHSVTYMHARSPNAELILMAATLWQILWQHVEITCFGRVFLDKCQLAWMFFLQFKTAHWNGTWDRVCRLI
jgi:hypothetical protein